MIKYLGSKRKLLDTIVQAVSEMTNINAVLDLFSGTARVGHALKRAGYHVIANDHNQYAATLATCYVEADANSVTQEAEKIISILNDIALQHESEEGGFFTETYAKESRFFQPKNASRIEVMRNWIQEKELPRPLQEIALTSLMEAADRVDSTTGVQMAYLKKWSKRSYNDIQLRLPELLPGPGAAWSLDAAAAAAKADVDLVYLDPPYNQHSYRGNYHIWETLVRWDKPDTYGVAKKRVDCKTEKSDFNSKRKIADALAQTLAACKGKKILLSFSNEGHLDTLQIASLLKPYGHVGSVGIDYKRYVGAQIGIHNPKGKKVGKVSHLRNKEHLYFVSQNHKEVRSVIRSLANGPSSQMSFSVH